MNTNIFIISCSLMITSIAVNPTYADHHHKPHDRLSFSINLGEPAPPPPAPTYIISNPPRYHRRLEWVDMREGYPLPMNAVAGGFQAPRSTLFVCRAFYQNGIHPGKLFNGICNIGWGGNEIVTRDYQVLVSRARLNWVPASHGYMPPNAIQGGDYDGGNPLYICQINYRGGTHPGKLVAGTCHVGWGGKEVTSPYYNVLVG